MANQSSLSQSSHWGASELIRVTYRSMGGPSVEALEGLHMDDGFPVALQMETVCNLPPAYVLLPLHEIVSK